MNGQMGHLQKSMRSRTILIFVVLLLVAGAVMSAVAWPAVLQAQNTSSLNLSSLSVTDQNGTTVSIGTFDPATTTYSGSVASTVERITVEAVASAGAPADIHMAPLDSQPATSGHQVDLSHGTNLILVSVHSFHIDEVLKTYSVLQITRAGTAASGTANTVSIGEGHLGSGGINGSLLADQDWGYDPRPHSSDRYRRIRRGQSSGILGGSV